jgi:addiction module HigA family antidote
MVLSRKLNLSRSASMPTASTQSPEYVLKSMMAKYQLLPKKLASDTGLSENLVRQLAAGKGRVTAAAALRLAKYFGIAPEYWLYLQNKADLTEAGRDVKLTAALSRIPVAAKTFAARKPGRPPAEKAVKKTAKAAKSAKGKTAKPVKKVKAVKSAKVTKAAKASAAAKKPKRASGKTAASAIKGTRGRKPQAKTKAKR